MSRTYTPKQVRTIFERWSKSQRNIMIDFVEFLHANDGEFEELINKFRDSRKIGLAQVFPMVKVLAFDRDDLSMSALNEQFYNKKVFIENIVKSFDQMPKL